MRRGHSLIEIIIAVLIIALLILAISGLTSMSIKMNLKAKENDESFSIARSICEMYKSNSDTYSNPSNEINIYKYINQLSDVQSISSLIANKNGNYNESGLQGIVNSCNGFKYTLILKIKKISSAENMEALWIKVIKNNDGIMNISMNAAK